MTQWLMNRESGFWTRTNILILAVGIEHVIIALKVVIALAIPDVPKHVKEAERRRPAFVAQAMKEMRGEKLKSGAVDMEEYET